MDNLLNGEDLLTVTEVARILRVNDATVLRYIKNQTLPSVPLPHANTATRLIHRIRRATLSHMLDDGYDEQAS